MRILWWGTYDKGKPRTRIMLRGLRELGIDVQECHVDVWTGVEDKTQIKGFGRRLVTLARWLSAYPRLLYRYLRAPPHDAVVVGYMGQLDVLVLWPFARLRRAPVVWDAFLSLYNTIVEDRALVGRQNPIAWGLYALEWLGCRAAQRVILDTAAHAAYFRERFRLDSNRVGVVFVGTEPEYFQARQVGEPTRDGPPRVLFYGQFIPLHGVGTIVEAARLAVDDDIEWVLLGRGQEEGPVRATLASHPLPKLRWIPWVDYRELIDWIHSADVCLGIFGDTDKAARVIPNKVFQVLSAGAPLVTRDSPAIRELIGSARPGIELVPAADPSALYAAVKRLVARGPDQAGPFHQDLEPFIQPRGVGHQLFRVLEQVVHDTAHAAASEADTRQ